MDMKDKNKKRNEKRQAKRRTKDGYIYRMYERQVDRSKLRGLPLPEYTRKEFTDWILSKVDFHKMFYNWVFSGYKKAFAPSIDRLRNEETYKFDNIRLLTWQEHIRTGRSARSTSRRVLHLTADNKPIGEFDNMVDASKKTNISYYSVYLSCNNNGKVVFGCKFIFIQ